MNCTSLRTNCAHLVRLVGFYPLLILLAACNKPAKENPSIRFAQLPNVHGAVTLIADAKGFYKSAGIDYLALSVPAGPDVVTALRAQGGAAADCGSIAVTPTVTMIGAGDEPVVIATTFLSDKAQSLVAFSKSGITADPASLKGKRVGVVRNTTGDIYFSRLLKKGALSEAQLTVVNSRPADLRTLLVGGALDAIVLWEPFITQTKREYVKLLADKKTTDRGELITFTDASLYTMAINIVTTRKKLQEKRRDLVEMLKATIQAGESIHKNPLEAQNMLESILKLEKGDLEAVVKTTDFRVHLNVPEMKSWIKGELDWLKESRPDVKSPDSLDRFIDASLLKSIDPKLVQE